MIILKPLIVIENLIYNYKLQPKPVLPRPLIFFGARIVVLQDQRPDSSPKPSTLETSIIMCDAYISICLRYPHRTWDACRSKTKHKPLNHQVFVWPLTQLGHHFAILHATRKDEKVASLWTCCCKCGHWVASRYHKQTLLQCTKHLTAIAKASLTHIFACTIYWIIMTQNFCEGSRLQNLSWCLVQQHQFPHKLQQPESTTH